MAHRILALTAAETAARRARAEAWTETPPAIRGELRSMKRDLADLRNAARALLRAINDTGDAVPARLLVAAHDLATVVGEPDPLDRFRDRLTPNASTPLLRFDRDAHVRDRDLEGGALLVSCQMGPGGSMAALLLRRTRTSLHVLGEAYLYDEPVLLDVVDALRALVTGASLTPADVSTWRVARYQGFGGTLDRRILGEALGVKVQAAKTFHGAVHVAARALNELLDADGLTVAPICAGLIHALAEWRSEADAARLRPILALGRVLL